MLIVDALDELIRKPDVTSECLYDTLRPQADPVPDMQSGSMFVGAEESGAATEAHLALREFRNTLSDSSPRVLSPLMLISTVLHTRCSASHSIATASSLLERFGSVSNLLSRTFDEIKSCTNLDDEALLLIRAIRELIVLVLREPIQDRPILSNNEALHSYLKFTMAHDRVESVKLLFLTSNNALIREEVHSVGTVDGVEVHPREVIKRALEVGAAALIIVHNHPSGDTTPSPQDIDMTRLLHSTLRLLGLSLHDHVIVGASRCFSMKEANLI